MIMSFVHDLNMYTTGSAFVYNDEVELSMVLYTASSQMNEGRVPRKWSSTPFLRRRNFLSKRLRVVQCPVSTIDVIIHVVEQEPLRVLLS